MKTCVTEVGSAHVRIDLRTPENDRETVFYDADDGHQLYWDLGEAWLIIESRRRSDNRVRSTLAFPRERVVTVAASDTAFQPPSPRAHVIREVVLQMKNCGSMRDFAEYQRELQKEIGE